MLKYDAQHMVLNLQTEKTLKISFDLSSFRFFSLSPSNHWEGQEVLNNKKYVYLEKAHMLNMQLTLQSSGVTRNIYLIEYFLKYSMTYKLKS